MKKLLILLILIFTTQAHAQTVVQRQAQFIDRFNRSNSSTDLGDSAEYTGSNGLAVSSNHIIDSAADLTNNYTRLDNHSYDDFIAEWDVYMVGSGFIGFVARATGATGTFYMFGTNLGTGGSDDSDTYWVKVELGSATGTVGSGDLSSSTVYHIKAVMQGTSIKIYNNGVLMVDTTDSAIASGTDSMYIWFVHNSTSSYIDNLQVTSLD